jgi:DNA recombination protein RmuC
MEPILMLILGFAAGSLVLWLVCRARVETLKSQALHLETDLGLVRDEVTKLREAESSSQKQIATLEVTLVHEKEAAEEKLELIGRAEQALRDAFNSLAGEALRNNNKSFLELAQANLGQFQTEAQGDLDARKQAIESLLTPINDSLVNVDKQVREIEKERNLAYGSLTQQVQSLIETQEALRGETGKLVTALRTPAVRGRWGEIQLRRVVEMAGMLSYCDFLEQETIHGNDGRSLRPDVIVKLPGQKMIVVDAKTPLEAYLRALEAKDETTRQLCLDQHAIQVREHMRKLGAKKYTEQFDTSPEFVVMFLPGETFFSAALEQNPCLIEEGVDEGVIPASPTTLIALLRAVAYGWRQQNLAENARQISELGKELHNRLQTMAGHMDDLKKGLDRAVVAYNKAAGSFESRVLVSARKFQELDTPVSDAILELQQIETTTRTLSLFDGENSTLEPDPVGQLSHSSGEE